MNLKRILSTILTMVLMLSVTNLGTITSFAADASHTVDASTAASRTNALVKALNGKYFTTTQSSCGNNSCDKCKNSNIITKAWLKKATGLVPNSAGLMPEHYYSKSGYVTSTAWSCAGFANYCLWYIYAKKPSDNVRRVLIYSGTFKKSNMDKSGVRTGDVIRVDNHHSFVYLSHNSSGVTVLDSNWDSSHHNLVKKHSISWSWRSGTTMAITRGKNWCKDSPHTHSYTTTGYESAHPHKVYKKCSCGAKKYTGETTLVSTCSSCMKKDTRYPTPFKCRIISTSKVKCYNDVNFSSSPGYIYPEDDCVITAVYSNGKVQCKCPWSDGSTKTLYVKKSVFINSSTTPNKTTAPKYAKTYLRTDMSKNIGWIDKGDTITIVATSGNKTQIIYSANVGQRCAWVYKSDLQQTYTVSYNANGGTDAPSKQTKNYGITLTLSSTKPRRTGYTFMGWATKSTAVSAQYQPKDKFTTEANTILYAVWRANKLSVYFHANGGTVTSDTYKLGSANIVYQKSTNVKYTQNWTYNAKKTNGLTNADTLGLIRTGYTFKGWGTTASGGTIFNQKDNSLVPTKINADIEKGDCSTTLYAIWQPVNYKVLFDSNNGTGKTLTQQFTYDVSQALTENSFVKPGYSFVGWSSNPSASTVSYKDKQTVKNLSSYDSETVKLYAVWVKDKVSEIIGDVDSDGRLDVKDATLIQMYLVDLISEDEINLNACDFNDDGIITVIDATNIQLQLAGLL